MKHRAVSKSLVHWNAKKTNYVTDMSGPQELQVCVNKNCHLPDTNHQNGCIWRKMHKTMGQGCTYSWVFCMLKEGGDERMGLGTVFRACLQSTDHLQLTVTWKYLDACHHVSFKSLKVTVQPNYTGVYQQDISML